MIYNMGRGGWDVKMKRERDTGKGKEKYAEVDM